MGDNSLPYRAEYAKSGRAACKRCKNAIGKDTLRLAVMVQSPFFDGKQPNWHHFSCFFERCRPKDTAEIEHYQSLRWEDQENIKKKIDNLTGATEPSSKGQKGKKRNVTQNIPNLQDFTIGYAKSGKSKCKLCQEFIGKNEVRISKKDFESEAALQYGPHERWHHVDCFMKVRDELEFFGSGSCLPGFKTLAPEDQKIIKSKIKEIKQDSTDGPSPTKKLKETVPDDVKDEMKKQNKAMFKHHDKLKDLQKSELISLLEYNNQEIPEGVSKILERLADAMTFGALEKCDKCGGQFVFKSGVGYACTGHVSAWAACENKKSKPSRRPFKVPKELKDEYDFLNKYKGKTSDRLFCETFPVVKQEVKEEVKDVVIKTENVSIPLESLQFLIHKSNGSSSDDLKRRITELGGKTVSKFNDTLTAVISTDDELKKTKLSKVISSAKSAGVPVVSSNFLQDITNETTRNEFVDQIRNYTISSWDADFQVSIKEKYCFCLWWDKKGPVYYELLKQGKTINADLYCNQIEGRIPGLKDVKKSLYPKKSEMFKSGGSVKKITVKDGLAVDPDSDLESVAHVYRLGKDVYSTVLSNTDVQKNRNSYYKMQILEGDKAKKYWLFRSWGRIGTTIGGNKVEKFSTVTDCIDAFKQLFEEKTGNSWDLRDNFEKVAGKMMMLDVNYEQEKNQVALKPKMEVSSSNLHKAVQDLISFIFDVEAMKKTMLEFELDLVKMPLGKISQSQIQKAFAILSELGDIIKSPDDNHLITDRTNRFYTLVPHDYGVGSPPRLDNETIIKEKIEVLNSLMEIEIAYKLFQECEESGNTIDDHYMKLNAEVFVVERDTDDFRMIEKYIKNTHAQSHMNYTLEIEEIFRVERKGESKRFKKFNKLPNKKLLWHGSRTTNFVGILSQGLRIAPPEAPSVGYMFGKGIYFADRVSKSANYCMTSKQNSTGLVLLCEVALGEMYELTQAKYIKKLPSGKHSVKGVGKSMPDPNEVAMTPTGAEVPLGSTVDAGVKDTSLLYNEYIVYDVGQVKIQYLVRLKFNYKV